jgi:hypothetical protein
MGVPMGMHPTTLIIGISPQSSLHEKSHFTYIRTKIIPR